MNLKQKLVELEDGRFKNIIEILDIKDICLKCDSFNYNSKESYLCGLIGSCIGSTLSKDFKSYLLWKLNVITIDEHFKNIS